MAGLGLIAMMGLDDVSPLCGLFSGLLDDVACAVCRVPMGVTATAAVFDRAESRVHVVLGSRMQAQREAAWGQFEAAAAQLDASPVAVECPSLDALRDIVRIRLRSHMRPLLEALGAPSPEDGVRRLASLDVQAFAAVEVGRRVPQSGLWLESKSRDGGAGNIDVYARVAEMQAASWISLLDRWLRKQEGLVTLGDDLDRHFRDEAVMPGADASTLRKVDEIVVGKKFSPRGEYLVEAVRARVHAAAGTPNPSAGNWALHHFHLGLQQRLGDPDAQAQARHLGITGEQASATVTFEAAWDAIARITAESSGTQRAQVWTALQEIAAQAGHPSLFAQFLQHGLRFDDRDPSAQKLVEMVQAIWNRAPEQADPQVRAGVVSQLAASLVRAGRIDDIAQALDVLIDRHPGDLELHAHLLAFLGSARKGQRQPRRFLDRIGATTQAWEHGLSAGAQSTLWNERSNAFRLLGLHEDALAANAQVLALLPSLSAASQRVARLNHAVLLRETGDVEASVLGLEAILLDARAVERIGPLESLAIGYGMLDRQDDAARCHREVLALSKGPMAAHADQARAQVALSEVLADRREEAVARLLELDECDKLNPFVLFPVGSAWATLLARGQPIPDAAADAIMRCLERLEALAVEAHAAEDVPGELGALRLLALLSEQAQSPEAEEMWEQAIATSDAYGQPPGMHELLALSRIAYARGDDRRGRELLLRLPHALARSGASAAELGNVSIGLERAISNSLQQLAEAVVEQDAPLADVRLVAEMQRDVVARARRLAHDPSSSVELAALASGLDAQALRRLAPRSGRVAVQEWLETESWLVALITIIDADGSVASDSLSIADIDLDALTTKMRNRLRDWTPARPGDPFDLPDWQAMQSWLMAELGHWLGDEAHVVFIEHHRFAGLPWHAAVSDRWTASYAASWGALLALPADADRTARQLGLALVPRYRESAGVSQALADAADRIESIARAHLLAPLRVEGVACDAQALGGLLGAVDVAVLLCHGFVAGDDHEVALMVAHAGALPPAHSVAAGAALARAHRFGWRQCARLEQAPARVFSSACSSSLSHVVGLGERLGLYAGLSRAGTCTLVAPRWDVVAASFLPILEQAIALNVIGRVPAAEAVRQACRQANEHHARWMSWALSLEGDWR
jgi:tetratricopeptide (TPR) repeat protein